VHDYNNYTQFIFLWPIFTILWKKGPNNMVEGFFENFPKLSPNFEEESSKIIKKTLAMFCKILVFFLENHPRNHQI